MTRKQSPRTPQHETGATRTPRRLRELLLEGASSPISGVADAEYFQALRRRAALSPKTQGDR